MTKVSEGAMILMQLGGLLPERSGMVAVILQLAINFAQLIVSIVNLRKRRK